MKSFINFIRIATCLVCLTVFSSGLFAQKIGLRIENDATATCNTNGLKVFDTSSCGGDPIGLSVCGDVKVDNNAVLEIAAARKVEFKGKRWTNEANAKVRGDGKVVFKEMTCDTPTEQELIGGGNSGSSFPNVEIDNPQNVRLITSSTVVRKDVKFTRGKVILTEDICVGTPTTTGTISSYSKDKYFVTDITPAGTKGALIRDNVIGTKVFPIGKPNVFAPVEITNTGSADKIQARVFDKVFTDGKVGAEVTEKTVGETWEIVSDQPFDLKVQYDHAEVGSKFDRTNTFLAYYVGTEGNTFGGETSSNKWSFVPEATATASDPGTIDDTGDPLTDHYENRLPGVPAVSPSGTSEHLFTVSKFDEFALPIELHEFDVKEENCVAILSWSTASETNNDYFEVQRGVDGQNFETIAKVNGAGNSTITQFYNFRDRNPNEANYYRLKQVDFNGDYAYTPVISFKSSCLTEETGITSLYPNPVKGDMTLNYTASQETTVQFFVFDMLGRAVISKSVDVNEGLNIIEMEVNTLPVGSYTIKHQVDGKWDSTPKRFVKID